MAYRFGETQAGDAVAAVDLTAGPLSATILTHGARVQTLRHADMPLPLVLGAARLAPYEAAMGYFGAMVGRFANRIAGGRFVLDGTEHRLTRNALQRHTLHGGAPGADQRLWRILDATPDAVRLGLTLAAGENGFPGEMEVETAFRLTAGALEIDTTATADAATPCSFAHHGYFRLAGGDVRTHHLEIAAAHYLPVDADTVPTGEIAPVAGTRFDFRSAREIGQGGLDHNFCLDGPAGTLRPVARLSAPGQALALVVETDAPGLQVYDGANTDGTEDHEGARLPAHAGIALETQAWPDAPNRADFPEAILRPGETYRHRVIYRLLPAGTPAQALSRAGDRR